VHELHKAKIDDITSKAQSVPTDWWNAVAVPVLPTSLGTIIMQAVAEWWRDTSACLPSG